MCLTVYLSLGYFNLFASLDSWRQSEEREKLLDERSAHIIAHDKRYRTILSWLSTNATHTSNYHYWPTACSTLFSRADTSVHTLRKHNYEMTIL